MRQDVRIGAIASMGVAILTVLAMITGIAILFRIGGASGVDVAAAEGSAIRSVVPLLFAAEALKLATAAAMLVSVIAVGRTLSLPSWSTGAGLVAVAAVTCSALFGFEGVAAANGSVRPGAVALVPYAGRILFVASGLWILSASRTAERAGVFPKWLFRVGLVLAAVSILSAIVPPLGLPTGLLAILWWTGLARSLRAQADPVLV